MVIPTTTSIPAQPWLKKIQWDEHGLVPVIAQEAGSGDILMFAWMNREALAKTVELGEPVLKDPDTIYTNPKTNPKKSK
jgi:phosphoribosyl-AMP cyclohydrolase